MSEQMSYRHRLAAVIEAGEVDPRRAAEKVVNDLTDDERDQLVMAALADAAGDLIRSVRRPEGADGQPSGRYGALKAVAADSMSWPVCPTGKDDGWKRLGDCTADELDLLAAGYEDRAARFTVMAKRYRTLAEAVRERGATTVADLPADVVHGLAAAA